MKIEVPIYVVAWRLLWLIPMLIGQGLFVAATFCGWGYYAARGTLGRATK